MSSPLTLDPPLNKRRSAPVVHADAKRVATVYTTAADREERLACTPVVQASTQAAADVAVFTGHRFQTIHGFGGSFTPSAARTWLKLPPKARQEFLTACFDPNRGNGYTLGRIPIHSCDFSDGNWTYVSDEDPSLKSFTVARDRQDVLPLVQAANAVAGTPVRLVASPWSPPAWMKDNGRMCQGGALLPEHYDTWARYFVRFLQAYAAEGVPIWGITTQNETEAVTPWENCTYTAAQERDFVRDHLGPALREAGLSATRLYIYDHNRDHMVTHCQPILDDADARAFITGVAYHWYVQRKHDNLRLLHDTWPDKEILFTEGCVELANKAVYEGLETEFTGFGSSGEQGINPLDGHWSFGERYARSMIEDFNRWNTGFIDWNLLLDERGGPNHVNNFCSAPIMADTRTGNLHYQSSYYYIGHFSRFVGQGARRALCTTAHDALMAAAFVNSDESRVVVVMNDQDEPRSVRLAVDDRPFDLRLPAHSISTAVVPPDR